MVGCLTKPCEGQSREINKGLEPQRVNREKRRSLSSNNQGPRECKVTPIKVIFIGSISQDVTLHKAESAWKPRRMQDQTETDKIIKVTEVIHFNVSGTQSVKIYIKLSSKRSCGS